MKGSYKRGKDKREIDKQELDVKPTPLKPDLYAYIARMEERKKRANRKRLKRSIARNNLKVNPSVIVNPNFNSNLNPIVKSNDISEGKRLFSTSCRALELNPHTSTIISNNKTQAEILLKKKKLLFPRYLIVQLY